MNIEMRPFSDYGTIACAVVACLMAYACHSLTTLAMRLHMMGRIREADLNFESASFAAGLTVLFVMGSFLCGIPRAYKKKERVGSDGPVK